MRVLAAISLVLLIILIPIGYRSLESVRYRNFRVVTPGKLYRSGQMTPEALERVIRELGIGTVITLRDTKDESGHNVDQAEVEVCSRSGVHFHRFPLADWSPIQGTIPGDQNIERFLTILDDPETRWPVLIHCFAGIHRTGAHCAVYRMEYEDWTPDQAIEEMKQMGTPRTTFADNLLEYLQHYQIKRQRSKSSACD
jgi:protein tyrosine/serine phosphatase